MWFPTRWFYAQFQNSHLSHHRKELCIFINRKKKNKKCFRWITIFGIHTSCKPTGFAHRYGVRNRHNLLWFLFSKYHRQLYVKLFIPSALVSLPISSRLFSMCGIIVVDQHRCLFLFYIQVIVVYICDLLISVDFFSSISKMMSKNIINSKC